MSILGMTGIGFFCGPMLSVASQWKYQVPGGIVPLATMTFGVGMSMFTALDGMTYREAFHLCIVTGMYHFQNLFPYLVARQWMIPHVFQCLDTKERQSDTAI